MGFRSFSILGLLLLFSIGHATMAGAAPLPQDKHCLGELRSAGVNFKIGPSATGMRTPVTIVDGRVGKIQFMHGNLIAKRYEYAK